MDDKTLEPELKSLPLKIQLLPRKVQKHANSCTFRKVKTPAASKKFQLRIIISAA